MMFLGRANARDTKFVSATNVARAGKLGNICVGNNVSATMCPRLPGPLGGIGFNTLSLFDITTRVQSGKLLNWMEIRSVQVCCATSPLINSPISFSPPPPPAPHWLGKLFTSPQLSTVFLIQDGGLNIHSPPPKSACTAGYQNGRRLIKVYFVGAYTRRRRRSPATCRPYSSQLKCYYGQKFHFPFSFRF